MFLKAYKSKRKDGLTYASQGVSGGESGNLKEVEKKVLLQQALDLKTPSPQSRSEASHKLKFFFVSFV